jgi:peroxidase
MNLPPPFAGVAQLRARLAAKVFDVHVMMTLPGTHTIGRSHCLSFTGRPVLL